MKHLYIISFLLLSCLSIYSQENDLSKLLESEINQDIKKVFTSATFKTTRLVNGHSIENTAAGVLDFRITHHFGEMNRGIYEFFGLDNATMRLALEYGITDWWMVGLGRSTYEKTIDGFTKIKLLRQSKGKRNMPVSLSYLGSMEVKTLKFENPERANYWTSNFYFNHQLLLARKFGERLSLQLMPTLVHWNLVPLESDPNDMLAAGAGGRFKLTRRTSLNLEYYYQIPGFKLAGTRDAFSIGFDIETGGHVFQVFVTNSVGITERAFITQTYGDWLQGDILTGFCISRMFTLKKKNAVKQAW